MVNSSEFQKAVELINKSNNVLITTHTRPDGDACGSIAALSDVLGALGKKVQPILLSPVPEWYEFLFAEKLPILGEDVGFEQLKQGQFAEPDLIMIIDTNSYSQLPQFDEYLKQADKPVLVIDHHVTADGLGDVELIDTTAAATALIVFDLLRYANWPVTKKVAQALFVAVATDTGWFHFSNTDSRVYRSCAELIDAGANPAEIYHDLYQNFSHQRFKLMTAMFNTLELHLDGRYATQHLRQRDFEQAGAAYSDTENLIDECRRLSTVEAAALFVELKDGRIRCSLRSRGDIDVRKIAQKFGGGGHTMAAGLYLPAPLKNAKQLILAEMAQQFKRLESK
ncbi:Bifunctional oligoribonuclease and PAP phosphatase NrnA [subsurface metagenome]